MLFSMPTGPFASDSQLRALALRYAAFLLYLLLVLRLRHSNFCPTGPVLSNVAATHMSRGEGLNFGEGAGNRLLY